MHNCSGFLVDLFIMVITNLSLTQKKYVLFWMLTSELMYSDDS